MKDLFSTQNILHGDCLAVMRGMEANSIDCILTDSPYGISFMGKHWDKGIPTKDFWDAALRVCKPGAMMLAFGGTRTYHRLACAIEDAGWEIRDCLMWLYASGFPKSMDVSKAIDKSKGLEREIIGIKPGHEGFDSYKSHSLTDGWDRPWTKDPHKVKLYHSQTSANSDLAKTFSGYGTALKPAYEPIILAMKPLDGTFAKNAEKWSVAGLNIDASRIEGKIDSGWSKSGNKESDNLSMSGKNYARDPKPDSLNGRWPSNLLLDSEAAQILDAQSVVSKSNSVGASRFFYCAKASPSERNKGCDGKNTHPTVKPIKLLEYLLKLIMPPSQDAVVLDHFAGSGSTLVAAKNLGFNAIGIEIDSEYCEIARRRIE